MASFKSAAAIGLLASFLGVPKTVVGITQWSQWPDQTLEEARDRAWDERRQAEARYVEQDKRAQQQAREEALRTLEELSRQYERQRGDAWRDARREAELRAAEENFREMNDAAAELAGLSERINRELNGGQQVMSKRMLKDLDRLEKLAKKVRNHGRRLPRNPI